MNLLHAKNLLIENTENLALQGRDLNKIFEIYKIKKYNQHNNILIKEETSTINNPNKIISKEINLYYYKTKKIKNVQDKTNSKSFDCKKDEYSKKNIYLKDSIEKVKKRREPNKRFLKRIKSKSNISLIRPIFVEEGHKAKKLLKKEKNITNPINININNNFNVNSMFNNFISKDFQKNSIVFNTNIKFPFNNKSF